MDCEASP